MKYNYPELKGICKNCLGCMRLESEQFKGIWRCDYYKEETNEYKNMEQSR